MLGSQIVGLLAEINESLRKSKADIDVASEALFTFKDVCSLMRCSDETLRKLIKRGDFPEPIIVSGLKRWPSSVINQHIISSNPQLLEKQTKSDELMAEIKKARSVA